MNKRAETFALFGARVGARYADAHQQTLMYIYIYTAGTTRTRLLVFYLAQGLAKSTFVVQLAEKC